MEDVIIRRADTGKELPLPALTLAVPAVDLHGLPEEHQDFYAPPAHFAPGQEIAPMVSLGRGWTLVDWKNPGTAHATHANAFRRWKLVYKTTDAPTPEEPVSDSQELP